MKPSAHAFPKAHAAASPLRSQPLPRFVRDLLASPPARGEGLNLWCFRVARVLHPFRDETEIAALLHAACAGGGIKRGEIERAIANSKAAAWQPAADPASTPATPSVGSRWPARDGALAAGIIRQSEVRAPLDLWRRSPALLQDDDGSNCAPILQTLFAADSADSTGSSSAEPGPLLCLGRSNAVFATRPWPQWRDAPDLSDWQFIVPSPMRARTGITKDGHESEHCLDNTGPRRFLVIEFDQGEMDGHAGLLWHLGQRAPLALVVHSGGKSLHGWFACAGQSEESLENFMRYAVRLGADPATWTRSQFVRLPAGQRDTGCRQSVFYLNPEAVTQ